MAIARKTKPQASDVCACGHAREAHEHYRRGTECSICDVQVCSAFTPVAVAEYSRSG